MKHHSKTAMACLMLSALAGNVYAQDTAQITQSHEAHQVLAQSQHIHSNDIDLIKSLIKKGPQLTQEIEYDNHVLAANAHKPQPQGMGEVTKAISSDSWQVVRIVAVASEDFPNWDIMSKYASITSENHGGNWLLVVTEEQAFQPLYGYVGVEAKFRYWNATELVNNRVDISDSIYTSAQRYWLVERSFTSGEFKFEANYASSTGTVRLHRELDIR